MQKILVVEEKLEMQTFISSFLSENGYEIKGVLNGTEALEEIRKNSFDLIILSLEIPENWLNILSTIRNDSKKTVIVTSTDSNVKDAIDSARLGAEDFISKPFDSDEFLSSIKRVLQDDENDSDYIA